VRVVSWNLNFRGCKAAELQGGLLRELAPDLMLLQEVNPGSSEVLREAAAADWIVRAIDLRTPEPDGSPRRWRGVAIAGRGLPRGRSWLLPPPLVAAGPGSVPRADPAHRDTDEGNAVYHGKLSRSARRELENHQATAGSRLCFLVVQTEWAAVVRRRRQHAVD